MNLEELIYLGRDNEIALQLSTDGVTMDHTTITRVQAVVGTLVIDSNSIPTAFDFTHLDRLILRLGNVVGLMAGRYTATLIVFDASHSNGVVWGQFNLTAK